MKRAPYLGGPILTQNCVHNAHPRSAPMWLCRATTSNVAMSGRLLAARVSIIIGTCTAWRIRSMPSVPAVLDDTCKELEVLCWPYDTLLYRSGGDVKLAVQDHEPADDGNDSGIRSHGTVHMARGVATCCEVKGYFTCISPAPVSATYVRMQVHSHTVLIW